MTARRLLKKKFAGKVKVIQQDHGGAPKARNRGAVEATGDILVFWDSDCYMCEGILHHWFNIFMGMPDVAFIYGGYRFRGQTNLQGHFPAGDFDPYMLTTSNHCSTMSPMRRAAFPGWDESLIRLQDWDVFLSITEKGGRGVLMPQIHFETEAPKEGDISTSKVITLARACQVVKAKHDIPYRPIRVSSFVDHNVALSIAKMLGADFENDPAVIPGYDHKLLYMIGMYPQALPQHMVSLKGTDGVRVIHWLGTDALSLFRTMRYGDVEAIADALKEHVRHHWCDGVETQRLLKKIRISAKDMPVPMQVPIRSAPMPAPGDRRVLVDGPGYDKALQGIVRAVPDIPLDMREGPIPIEKYCALIRLSPISARDQTALEFLMHGRHVFGNIKEKYFGYVGEFDEENYVKSRAILVNKLRKIFHKEKIPRNSEAMGYYKSMYGMGTTEGRLSEMAKHAKR